MLTFMCVFSPSKCFPYVDFKVQFNMLPNFSIWRFQKNLHQHWNLLNSYGMRIPSLPPPPHVPVVLWIRIPHEISMVLSGETERRITVIVQIEGVTRHLSSMVEPIRHHINDSYTLPPSWYNWRNLTEWCMASFLYSIPSPTGIILLLDFLDFFAPLNFKKFKILFFEVSLQNC